MLFIYIVLGLILFGFIVWLILRNVPDHKWVPYGGPVNMGNGKFKKRFKCKECGEIKEVVH